jgi:phosphoglucosamine mutase
MARLFGTDGVRGVANGDVLTPELAMALAASAARELGADRAQDDADRVTVAIGRDTRPSGPMLEAAAAAGFAGAGCDVLLLGVVPTPTVAHACATGVADLGLMISASHNPMPDNGLKLFGRGGHKLPDAVEDAVAAGLDPSRAERSGPRPTGTQVGRISTASAAPRAAYVEHLLATQEAPLDGLRVVVDCAHGSASELAPEVYRRAGADVVAVFADGDGERINDGCGATHLEALQAAVREHGADVGLAHDGDADRCLATTADARVVDGDAILAVCGLGLRERGLLPTGTVVATVMSNLGFVLAMRDAGIEVLQTAVGDRYVLEAMRTGGHALGGEQSGHVVFGGHATTGDGLLTGLALLGRVAATGRTLAELASVVTPLPQVLLNVRAERSRAGAADVLEAVVAEERGLGETGRVLLRPSGTEPVVRVMVEAPTDGEARAVAERLAKVVGR